MDLVTVPAKFEVRSFTRSWDNTAYLKILGSPWIRPRSLFSKNFYGLLFVWTLWMYFEVRSFTRSWDNSGYLKSLGSRPWLRPRSLFSKIFNALLFRWTLFFVNVGLLAKFEVRSFTRSWDNRGYFKTLGSPWIRRSRSSKVIDFGTNRKRVCDFLGY